MVGPFHKNYRVLAIRGLMAKRLLAAALLIPALFAWLAWQGRVHGLYDIGFGAALFAYSTFVAFTILIWIGADLLNRLAGERSLAERNLRKNENRFRATFDQAAVGFAHVLPNGAILCVNEKLCQIVGFTKDEFLAKNFADITVPDESGGYRDAVQAMLSGHTTFAMDKRYLHRDGRAVWTRLTASVVRAASGEPDYVVAVFEDITRRRLAEERSNLLAEAAPSGMLMTGSDGRIALVNARIEKLFGYSREELLGKPIETLVPDRSRANDSGYGPAFQAASSMRPMGQGRNLFGVRKDGSEVPIEISIKPLTAVEGQIVIASMVYITERKAAECTLHHSELRFRELADALPQIVWTASAVGCDDYHNYRWHEFTGFSAQDGQSDAWRKAIIHPEDYERWRRTWSSAVRSGQAFEIEYRFWDRKFQDYRWYLGRALPVRDDRGAIMRWFGTCTDIHIQKTENQHSEAVVLARTEELRRSLQEKDTLFKEVHHRVKNNLQIISSLLRMQGETLKDNVAAAALKESQHRVLSMALIHERLYGSRQMDEIDFGEYTATLMSELFHSYAQPPGCVTSRLKTARVLLNIDQAIPCGLILNELVTNALKYAYPNGQTGEVTVEISQLPSGRVSLIVADGGVGLPEGFVCEDSKSLGLSIVSMLAEQLDGSLSVRNEGGVTFTVEFPKESRAAVKATAA